MPSRSGAYQFSIDFNLASWTVPRCEVTGREKYESRSKLKTDGCKDSTGEAADSRAYYR